MMIYVNINYNLIQIKFSKILKCFSKYSLFEIFTVKYSVKVNSLAESAIQSQSQSVISLPEKRRFMEKEFWPSLTGPATEAGQCDHMRTLNPIRRHISRLSTDSFLHLI